MTPIQQMLLGVGAKKKTYMEDVFSTYLWTGNGNDRTITNGIDLKGEGGMVWVKDRGDTSSHIIADTARDDPSLTGQKYLSSNDTDAETSDTNGIKYFYNTGFSTGSGGHVNTNGDKYSSWTFRKAKGFFDVVTYTGTGAQNLQISHNLGCVPGMILIKNLSSTDDWFVYHRETNAGTTNARGHYGLTLNSNAAKDSSQGDINYYEPTSEHFRLGYEGHGSRTNTNGDNYVAYLFGGGESGAATARSVDFDGTADALVSHTSTSDFGMGTGDFTVEKWIYPRDLTTVVQGFDTRSSNYDDGSQWTTYLNNDGTYRLWFGSDRITSRVLQKNEWQHIAIVRHSGTTKMYLNGVSQGSYSDSNTYTSESITISAYMGGGYNVNGKVSNVRVVKGTAVYTSDFRPPTAPLTSISGTVLLCCNNSSVTGTTTGTITSSGDPTASTDSPFDDPAAFKFGDSGDQNVIKCGSYVGNGSTDGPEIFLGWEPSWILLKNASTGSTDWLIIDEMRGISADSQKNLRPNKNDAEGLNEWLNVSSTGFKIKNSYSYVNTSGDNYIFMCLRRSDGYVGKPVETATDVFAMDVGNSSSSIPVWDSGFPVDFAFHRQLSTTSNWWTGGRLMQGKYLQLNANASAGTYSGWAFDSNTGFSTDTKDTDWQAWMWKRHAGFDVVTYAGNKVAGLQIPHSLNAVPEMMWVKNRGSAEHWAIYHKGLNGGTNPEQYFIKLDEDEAEYGSASSMWNSTAPTSTHFTLGSWDEMNANNGDHIAMLFSSVDGISKVGSWVGSNSAQTITLGFEPRFLLLKNIDTTNWWEIRDTDRGWATSSGGTSQALYPNDTYEESSDTSIHKTATGFVLAGNVNGINKSGFNYIYYAHA